MGEDVWFMVLGTTKVVWLAFVMVGIASIREFFGDYPLYRQSGWDKLQTDDQFPYLGLTILFGILMFVFETYVDIRQLSNFYTIKTLPKEIKGVVSEDTFKKSSHYGGDKLFFGRFESLFSFFFALGLLLVGWFPYAWDLSILSSDYTSNTLLKRELSPLQSEILTTIIFVVLTSIVDTLFSLPFSLYATFVIEQRHGFNKTTLALYIQDKLMTIALSFVIGSPILACMIWVIRLGGPFFYFYVWIFFFVVSVVMMLLYPSLIAPLFNKYTKLEEGPVYEAIEKLAKKVSFPLTQIYMVDGSRRSAHSNAYFYGFFKSKRIVLYDTLLKQVELPELLAIVGHEIGHWRLWHTIQGFVITQIYIFSLFLVFSFVQQTPGLFLDFGFAYSSTSPMPVFIGLTLFMQAIWTPVEKVLNLLLHINSRANEFAADAYANQLGMGDGLCSGLVKISVENLGNMVPDSLYSLYHFSHPPLVERLRAIQSADKKAK